MNALLSRVQALDERMAIVSLTAAQRPSMQPDESSPEFSIPAVSHRHQEDDALRTLREQIERLTTQFTETHDCEGQNLSSTSQNDEDANKDFLP